MAGGKLLGLKLQHWILVGMLLGLVAGLILNGQNPGDKPADPTQVAAWQTSVKEFKDTMWWFDLLGKTLFVGALKMLIAPLILASIVTGITSLPSMERLGSIGWKTLIFYFCTTTVAVAIGLGAVLTIQPGKQKSSQKLGQKRQADINDLKARFIEKHPGAKPDSDPQDKARFIDYLRVKGGEGRQGSGKYSKLAMAKDRSPGDMFKQDILKPILSNPFKSLAETNSLGIIFFAILLGLACMAIGEQADPVAHFFAGLNGVMMKITLWVMATAPLAIGCLIVSTVARQGMDVLWSLMWYCITVVAGIGVHVAVLLALVALFGGMNPWTFVKGILSAWLVAFSTTSSAATLPVTMECVEDNLGVDPQVSNFALPVGATCNMDGTALYEGVAVIFLIQIFGSMPDVGIELTAAKTVIIFITAVLASVGAAAVPSAGLITMAIVASAVGLPVYYIPILFAVDHLLDQFRTSTNVLGDAAATVVVSRWCGLDR